MERYGCGLPDKRKDSQKWCAENDINIKTYYYRLRRVREAALRGIAPVMQQASEHSDSSAVFTELDFEGASGVMAHSEVSPAPGSVALTVRMGCAKIDIYNGASADVLAGALRVIGDIC